jgi:hypothetical protein
MKYILLFVSLVMSQLAFPASVSEYDMKATYLYNFIAFTTWPNLQSSENIHVCSYGRDNFGQSLQTINGKKAHNSNVVVSRISSISSAKKCHLLYVAEKEASSLKYVYNELAGAPVLVVTDTPVPSTAMINLYLDGQRLVFEINQNRASSAGLQISSKLLQYSRPMLVQE